MLGDKGASAPLIFNSFQHRLTRISFVKINIYQHICRIYDTYSRCLSIYIHKPMCVYIYMYEQAVSSNPLYPYILNIFLPTLPARRSEIPLNDWLQRHAQNVVKVPLRYAVNSARACTVGGSCLVPCGITSGNLT